MSQQGGAGDRLNSSRVTHPGSASNILPPAVIRPPQRKRWPHFATGLAVGLLVGFFALLLVAIALSRPNVFVAGQTSDNPDLWISINHDYFNSVVRQQVTAAPIDITVSKVTDVQVGFASNNAGLTITPTFDLNLFTTAPSVDVQLGVANGSITGTMLGEPRLGAVNVPINSLPFDLGGTINDGVNQVLRDVLLKELNNDLKAGFGSDQFNVTQVSTTSDYMIIKLKRK